MPFGLWARMGRRSHALDGGPAVLRDVAMATNFGTQFAINGFVGYNNGCMIASDTLFVSRGGFLGVKLSDEDVADFDVRRDVAMAAIFRLSTWDAHWRHLANTSEPSMCGGDAVLSNYFEHLLHSSPQSVIILCNWTPLSRSIIAASQGGSGPNLIHGSPGPPKCYSPSNA